MTRKETLKNEIVMIGSGKSAPFYLLTENSAKLHIEQLAKTTDKYGQIGTSIPNTHILSAWCNQDKSVVVPLSGTGTGLRVYVANDASSTSDTLKQLTNTAVVINVLYYDFD